MKKGDKIKFYLFGAPASGVVDRVNRKEGTVNIAEGGVIYPNVQTFKELPKKKKEVPPWYILKIKKWVEEDQN